tara:strand:- start:261 stop:437 length:177 start_codon:yes stop_codon:yes gene_type:complete
MCKGIGLIKREYPFKCNNCNNKGCYLCENANKGLYIECHKCFGSGSVLKKLKIIRYNI